MHSTAMLFLNKQLWLKVNLSEAVAMFVVEYKMRKPTEMWKPVLSQSRVSIFAARPIRSDGKKIKVWFTRATQTQTVAKV